jgi:uncharacterized protein YjiS (DUF1127 family)
VAIWGLFAAAWSAAAEYRRLRRAENDLAQLDDRMLRDLGITRAEIAYLARFGRDALPDRAR